MKLYEVVERFKDGQDDNYLYEVGALYPRPDYKPSEARIKELETDNNRRNIVAIVEVDLTTYKVAELKDITEQYDVEVDSSMKKAELIKAIEGVA
ncbi:TPA: Rho termination factor N-terminal domain-containing protein [Staphylococcus pseudintermedius]|uniref:HeH/LEM domain-containing protein n=1 Tax=Staphylococcus pseudintermedius TaxID=283734 RepID=UPI0019DACCB4|nr:HeH/LEM domain-containing protein [Staphylococcus pseudintermedius]EGQ2772288.1 Rho termination protein [Staphylococcus pseudintermedius]EGQ3392150.1 Rho termination protein [Staphylococcus pseudintermedius]EGQ3698616.1 Rho termination protein [Staphylococcus pseudintermedius]EGQ4077783.1 Rho termination protein [Staphylococcus pseudintermedius]EGQ4313800.1 Rho termination protein [Staphylococcus pseudintermedius]